VLARRKEGSPEKQQNLERDQSSFFRPVCRAARQRAPLG
jgi:hypothetical protein